MRIRHGRASVIDMTRAGLLPVLLMGLLLSACRAVDREVQPTPTPFPKEVRSQRVTTAAPIPITLDNLAANPDFYVGATLHLTGHFRRLPLLACQGEAVPSPATWGLESDGFLANASGMDEQLRSLLEEDQLITVEGRWLRFEGPLGCEPFLNDQTIWYLSADQILDPHPLVRAQATANVDPQDSPGDTGAAIATAIVELPADDGVQATATTIALPTETAAATAVPSVTPQIVPATPGEAVTATFTPLPSATAGGASFTPTPDAGLTATVPVAGSPTATPDGTGQATATADPGASATPSGSTPGEKGALDPEDLIIDMLSAGATDRWTLDLIAGDMITITVAPGGMANIILSVLDSNGTALVNNQNLTPVGEVETIKDLNIAEPGIYDLLIKTEQGIETDYALMFMDQESYSFVFRGTLVNNATKSDTLPADTDQFWFFNAVSGESVSFTVTPDSGSDPYIELYDPSGARMLTLDDTGEGEAESLETYTLVDGGMYGIRVAEFDFRPMSYQIVLTKP